MLKLAWCSCFFRILSAFTLSPHYNFASLLQPWYQEHSVEELATATITIRGAFDDTVLQILQTSAEQTLKAFCAQGSILIFTELEVQESALGNRIVTLEFQILPPRDGGGDCAWELRKAAEGKDTGPFDECDDCIDKRPVIRRAILGQLRMYALTRNVQVDNWYMKMFSIYCRRLEIVMPKGFPPMMEKDFRCEDFFPEGTRWPGADESTTTTAVDGSSTTSKDTAVSTQDLCSWIRDACICATVTTCSWLPDGDGIRHCVQVASPPSQTQRCDSCPTLPECPSDPVKECPLALSICACSLMSAGCNWTLEGGECFAPSSGPVGVPCAMCPFAVESCPMPRVISITPYFGTDLGSDSGYDINLTFDQSVRNPNVLDAVQGDMQIGCSLDEGQFLPANAPDSRRANFVIQVPSNKRLILSDRMVQIPLGSEQFWSRYVCMLNISRGAMIGVNESVPSLEKMKHVVFIRDNVPPIPVQFSPGMAEANVALDTSVAIITINEPWWILNAEAELWKLKENSGPEEYELVRKLQMEKTSTDSSVEELRIPLGTETLAPDAVLSIKIPTGALVDRAGNHFVGIQVGDWAFRTTVAVGLVQSQSEGLSAGEITGIVLGCVALVAIAILCIAIQRYKLIRKFEKSEVKPMEGGTPKASQVSTLHNDSELLPSNEKFWEKALIRSKEDLVTDTLDELPLELPGGVAAASNRRPSNASQSLSNQRRPSNATASNQLSDHRHGSKTSATASTNLPSNQRRPSKVSDDRGIGSRRPSNASNQPSNQRHASNQSAGRRRSSVSDAGSLGLRSNNLGVESNQVGSRSPSKDACRSEGMQGRTREESESVAASRRAMLGAGPATLSKPTTPCRPPASRQVAT